MTRLVAFNGLLLALVAIAIIGIQGLERNESSVESSVRRYAIAVSHADVDGAMAEIAPDQRSKWTNWVRAQLGDIYDVRGIAVRSPSVLQRLSQGLPGGPLEVTVVLDINRDIPDYFYQPTTRVRVETSDGRPFLGAPLLADRVSE